MKRKSNIPRLVRPADAFLPVALLLTALMGHCMGAALFYAGFMAITLLSLFARAGVRLAFATQPAVKSARGSVKCALLLQTAALVAALAACRFVEPLRQFSPVPYVCAGFLFNIEHLFYEYLFAIGDGQSATLSHGIAALLLLVGLCLTGETGARFQPEWLVGLSALAALIALVVSLATGGGAKGRINARVVACAPAAALQTCLYPLAALLLTLFPSLDGLIPAFFCGMTLYALCRTPFRRSELEARALNRVLLIVCAACAAVAAAALLLKVGPMPVPQSGRPPFSAALDIPMTCAALALAALCAFTLFGRLPRRERDGM